jgi:hypothetical protein
MLSPHLTAQGAAPVSKPTVGHRPDRAPCCYSADRRLSPTPIARPLASALILSELRQDILLCHRRAMCRYLQLSHAKHCWSSSSSSSSSNSGQLHCVIEAASPKIESTPCTIAAKPANILIIAGSLWLFPGPTAASTSSPPTRCCSPAPPTTP